MMNFFIWLNAFILLIGIFICRIQHLSFSNILFYTIRISLLNIMNRVGKWSRVSRKTRLKIGLAISQDLKCKTCKTEKLVKIKHFWSFWEENTFFSANTTVIPHLKCFCAANWLAKLAGNDKEINKLLRKKFLNQLLNNYT